MKTENRLIDIFMGKHLARTVCIETNYLNWDNLLPVVEKIISLNKNGNSDYLHLRDMPLSSALNINYLKSKVVNFINWYNTQL